MSESAYDDTFFERHVQGSLASAEAVLPILFEYFKPESVVDVGCGMGAWLSAAAKHGISDLLGIDGPYVDRKRLLIPPDQFAALNLDERIDVGRRFELAISLEVAEHLPLERAETFVADLASLSDIVLFSAALPYQGGTEHVNEQWLEYWAILFRGHGYVPCDIFRSRIWGDRDVDYWYSQNLLVFCASHRAIEIFGDEIASGPLSKPHPLTFVYNATRYRPLAAPALDVEFQDFYTIVQAWLRGDVTVPPLRMWEAGEAGQKFFPDARTLITDPREDLASNEARIEELNAALQSARLELDSLRERLEQTRKPGETNPGPG